MKTSVVLCVSLCVAASAFAADETASPNGSTSQGVQMQAGPGDEYPDVMRLAPDLKVTIHACARAWDWCDVEWRGNRGWVPATALHYRANDTLLPVRGYGPRLGLAQVEFNLTEYWDAHYSQRPWYGERAEWAARGSSNVLAEAALPN